MADYEKQKIFACEGFEQRIVPTGLAPGGNEIDGAPEFQRNAFSESGYYRKSVMGKDTTECLRLAMDMLPGWGIIERFRLIYFVGMVGYCHSLK